MYLPDSVAVADTSFRIVLRLTLTVATETRAYGTDVGL